MMRRPLALRYTIAALVAGIVGLAIWAIIAVNRPGGTVPAQSTDTAIADGREIYAEQCAACHGADLEGQPNWRTRLPDGRLPAPPHDATGHTWHHPDRQLFDITKYGTKAFAPPTYKTDMMGFGDTLSDAQIQAVLAFIKSRWPPAIRQRQSAIGRRQSR